MFLWFLLFDCDWVSLVLHVSDDVWLHGKSDCCLQNKTDAETMSLLDPAGKIYMIGCELHGDEKDREPVATWTALQNPPQTVVEWTRLPLKTWAALDNNWRFYSISASPCATRTRAPSTQTTRLLLLWTRSEPMLLLSRPPSTCHPPL